MENILLKILLLFPLFLNAQKEDQTKLAKFIITDASKNGQDITSTILKAGAYTVFYTSGDDGLIYLANVWPNSNSQSYGPMYSIESDGKEETSETYKADFFYFNWKYYNTYDSKTGTAKVQVVKIYKNQGIAFTIRIIPENLDLIIYKGYMEGSVDFQVFNKYPKPINSSGTKFRKDYNVVSAYNTETAEWSDWEEGENTFVINFNSNGDIAHYKANGEVELYKKISRVEEGTTLEGEHYQIITALDKDGNKFKFQFFDELSIGLKLIYSNIMIQFARK